MATTSDYHDDAVVASLLHPSANSPRPTSQWREAPKACSTPELHQSKLEPILEPMG